MEGSGSSALGFGVGELPPGWRLLAYDTIGSTNDEAMRLARAGAAHGTVVTARRQEAGRGRRGRSWTSPEGNLFASLVLRPAQARGREAQLSFVSALALAEAVGMQLPPSVSVRTKWPNDLLLDGAKAAGILLETETSGGGLDWLVLGIGVNVNHHPENTPYPTTSLRAKAGRTQDPARLLGALVWHFEPWYRRWIEEGFGPVRTAWLAHAHGLGGPVTVRLEHVTIQGRFADLDPEGALLLELGDGTIRRVTAGDVFFGDLPEGG